jgi:transposase
VPPRNRADRRTSLVALGDDLRLLLSRPAPAPTGTGEHFQTPRRLRLKQKLSVRHVANGLEPPSDNRRSAEKIEGGVKAPLTVHLALGYVDMRKGIDGLAMLVQGVLRQDPFSGHLFVFRGRTRANLIKIVFWDGTGLCLFTKRLEHGVFLWPPSIEPSETLSLTSAQLSLLIEGIDWRAPEQRWRPAVAG